MRMIHKGCGGTLFEGEHVYVYCSNHEDCDLDTCTSAFEIPELLCDKCHSEIQGDIQIQLEEED